MATPLTDVEVRVIVHDELARARSAARIRHLEETSADIIEMYREAIAKHADTPDMSAAARLDNIRAACKGIEETAQRFARLRP